MNTLLDLANDLDAVLTRIGGVSKQVVNDVALSVLNDLVQSTPADVGTALSNWQLTLDSPASGTITAFVPSPKGRMVKGVWTHAVDPVLTAQANVPASGTIAAFAPSPKGRMVKGVWTHAVDPVLTAQANVPAVLDVARLVLASREIGQIVYITNNLPYIQKLDEGDSKQAPAGFVDRAAILGRQVVERVRL